MTMRHADPRAMRRAVLQLASCADEDVEWIMGTLTPAQRERLAGLVEEGTEWPTSVDEAERRLDILLLASAAPLASRFRLTLEREGGEGRLTARARSALGIAVREVAASLTIPVAEVPAPSALGGLFARLRRGARR
jgi:hypothetical protein